MGFRIRRFSLAVLGAISPDLCKISTLKKTSVLGVPTARYSRALLEAGSTLVQGAKKARFGTRIKTASQARPQSTLHVVSKAVSTAFADAKLLVHALRDTLLAVEGDETRARTPLEARLESIRILKTSKIVRGTGISIDLQCKCSHNDQSGSLHLSHEIVKMNLTSFHTLRTNTAPRLYRTRPGVQFTSNLRLIRWIRGLCGVNLLLSVQTWSHSIPSSETHSGSSVVATSCKSKA